MKRPRFGAGLNEALYEFQHAGARGGTRVRMPVR